MSDFLEELNESISKVIQRKTKWHQFITTSELFTGAKEYMDIGEYFERFCNDHNTGYQLWKWELDKEPIDFNLWEEVRTVEIVHKIVQFDEYCPKCVYRDYDEAANPCYECLTMPANVHTAEPIYFKEGKAKVLKAKRTK